MKLLIVCSNVTHFPWLYSVTVTCVVLRLSLLKLYGTEALDHIPRCSCLKVVYYTNPKYKNSCFFSQ